MSPLLDPLIQAARANSRTTDEALITKAFHFAQLAHIGQKRKSGHDFITHPVTVATYLASWNMDTTTIVAGLLHDTIEDGGALYQDLVSEFGSEVADLVEGVTKVSGIHLKGQVESEFVENLRKMILVMAKDLRVILVKLADRYHNLQTLEYLPLEKQTRIAIESLEIYAPLAERLGMGLVKGEIEDLAFKFAYPQQHRDLLLKSQKRLLQTEKIAEDFKKDLLVILRPQFADAQINIRQKHLYSLFRKLNRPEIGGDLGKIHDLLAARIVLASVEDCYHVLGLIHRRFKPVPHLGVSDYIANPKPNGYQSIHTKIFHNSGHIIEIQIRTREMHHQAEMGIASHWHYSEVKNTGLSDTKIDQKTAKANNKLKWVRQLASWQKELTDNNEYLNALKFDALNHRIFVFSPIGDVYDLPDGATVIDFAYAVHTKLGHQAIGAKVNDEMVSLNSHLKNGDVVEILVDKKKTKPNAKWLEFVVTHTAKKSISKALVLDNAIPD